MEVFLIALYIGVGLISGLLIGITLTNHHNDVVTHIVEEHNPWTALSTAHALEILAKYEIPHLSEQELKQCRSVAARIMNMRSIGSRYYDKYKR